jgi:valyl-tRNA synthetase
MSENLSKAYEPKEVEKRIYRLWLESGFFAPEAHQPRADNPNKNKTFVTLLPPPNITGSLHMGHALQDTVMDILVRMKRMQGYRTLWLPGIDHAGIATQNAVEKQLRKEGTSRFDLGREKFVERVWEWKNQYGTTILNQLKELGASCDWSRTVFTMDPHYAKKVLETFLHYYEKGWIVRAQRVINWCTRCQTSLSDLELEYKEEKGTLWFIKYPLSVNHKPQITNSKQITNHKSQIPKYITVATTRPETMLGDEAVAVNPNDERYKHLVGQKVILPIQEKEIPVVSDQNIDPAFGTGLLKVTPAHDLSDYEIALRHSLPLTTIVESTGRMNSASKICEGLKVSECREKVIETLRAQNLIEKEEEYANNVAHCYRCYSTIEPHPSWQWFLKMGELAKVATEAVQSKKVVFYPERWEKVYFDWLEHVRDWCISRQLWWGHQIPVWFCKNLQEFEFKTQNLKLKTSEGVEIKKMGFAGDVVSQIFINKTRTYRLRDHEFKRADLVAFENSATGEIFGYGTITEISKTTIGGIDLKDPKHHKPYSTREELIAAFKRHPQKIDINTIDENTPVWIYTYDFKPANVQRATEQFIVSLEKPKKCPVCGECEMVQSEDVLDTWFSAALWPFATLKSEEDLKQFYPSNVLVTARDIINLWVGRMIFSGIEFMGKEPFGRVLIHPTVLTKEGKRMSKSLGTGIDPLLLIEKYGADATRWGIAYQLMGGQDLKFGEENMIMGKKFCNKIWNASRFVLLRIGNPKTEILNPKPTQNPKPQTAADIQVLEKLSQTIKTVSADIESYDFGQAAHTLYDFFWHDFCDVYLEESKNQQDENTNALLLFVLVNSLKLLHPFIPFISEEIYQTLPLENKKLLLVENWPSNNI